MPFVLLALLASTPRIDEYLAGCAEPADGFVAPARSTATAPAPGTVSLAADGRVELTHCFYENHLVREVRSRVEGLTSLDVRPGDRVGRGQRLGAGARVHVTIDDAPAADFVRGRERLFVPRRERVLVVVDVDAHRAVRFVEGRATDEWEIASGQAEGAKEQRGDLRTPRGLYFVVHRTTGPFGGEWAGYFGEAFVKLDYPNAFDAARGLDGGLVTAAEAAEISTRWRRREATPQRTKLGGGIGFHGWIAPWDGDAGYGLSWGCVVMHPAEVKRFSELVPLGSAVVLL
ncbi:MAG: L,D-transpeptidase family protein [Myxococcota bacterium]